MNIELGSDAVLLVVDMQNDFLPGGSLAVPNGDKIIPGINSLASQFHQNHARVIYTQDWHPIGHHSFASSHPNKKPGDSISIPGLGPVLWPDHCVQDTPGAALHKDLETKWGIAVIRKGYTPTIDSYSAFYENDQKTRTGLAGYLHELGIKRVFICGLAYDYCCFYSAMDAKRDGFDVYMVEDLSQGIDLPPGNMTESRRKMHDFGIHLIGAKFLTEEIKS
jgi:nicotinamidase/pyrazinamidase